MTEKEAKKKWCPLSSHNTRDCIRCDGDNPSLIYTGPGKGLPEHVCIAAACMMWRWFDTKKTEGYCGLGGKLK
jgi:hypothetical protein